MTVPSRSFMVRLPRAGEEMADIAAGSRCWVTGRIPASLGPRGPARIRHCTVRMPVSAEHEPRRRAAICCSKPTAPAIRPIGNDLRERLLLQRLGGRRVAGEGAVELAARADDELGGRDGRIRTGGLLLPKQAR